ncbi:hypothetical protein ACMFMG_004254 [Clarireedia jacksonii]
MLGADQHRIGLSQHLVTTTASLILLTSYGILNGRNPEESFVLRILWKSSSRIRLDCAEAATLLSDHEVEKAFLYSQSLVRAALETSEIVTFPEVGPYIEPLQPLARSFIKVKVVTGGLSWNDFSLCTSHLDQDNLSTRTTSRPGQPLDQEQILDAMQDAKSDRTVHEVISLAIHATKYYFAHHREM